MRLRKSATWPVKEWVFIEGNGIVLGIRKNELTGTTEIWFNGFWFLRWWPINLNRFKKWNFK